MTECMNRYRTFGIQLASGMEYRVRLMIPAALETCALCLLECSIYRALVSRPFNMHGCVLCVLRKGGPLTWLWMWAVAQARAVSYWPSTLRLWSRQTLAPPR